VLGSETKNGPNGSGCRNTKAKLRGPIFHYAFDCQGHTIQTQLYFIGQLLAEIRRPKDSNSTNRIDFIGGKLAESNARLARDEVAMEDALTGLKIQGAFQRAQSGNAAACGNLKGDMRFADGEGHHAAIRFDLGGLQGGDRQGKTHWLQPGCFQAGLQKSEVISGHSNQQGVLSSLFASATRSGNQQRADIRVETALGFNLQKAEDICLGQFRDRNVSGHGPFQGQPHDTFTLAHTRSIEVIANLASDQLRIIGQRIERKRNGQRILNLQGAIDTTKNQGFKSPAIKSKSENGHATGALWESKLFENGHVVPLAGNHFWRASLPKAQPRLVRSLR
jgi:hypothetical protein